MAIIEFDITLDGVIAGDQNLIGSMRMNEFFSLGGIADDHDRFKIRSELRELIGPVVDQ